MDEVKVDQTKLLKLSREELVSALFDAWDEIKEERKVSSREIEILEKKVESLEKKTEGTGELMPKESVSGKVTEYDEEKNIFYFESTDGEVIIAPASVFPIDAVGRWYELHIRRIHSSGKVGKWIKIIPTYGM